MSSDPATGLTLEETLAVGAVLASMQRSQIPLRRPSVNQPPYWGESFVVNTVAPVPPTSGPNFLPLLSVPTKPEYYAVVTGFTVSTLGPLGASGLVFRLVQDEAVMDNTINFPAGVDRNRITPSTWPTRPTKIRLVLPMNTQFSLEYRNESLGDRYALCALFGYYAAAKDATVLDSGGVTDA